MDSKGEIRLAPDQDSANRTQIQSQQMRRVLEDYLLPSRNPDCIVTGKIDTRNFSAQVDRLQPRPLAGHRPEAEKVLIVQHRLQLLKVRLDGYRTMQPQIK